MAARRVCEEYRADFSFLCNLRKPKPVIEGILRFVYAIGVPYKFSVCSLSAERLAGHLLPLSNCVYVTSTGHFEEVQLHRLLRLEFCVACHF